MMKDNFETALKVGRPTARIAEETGHQILVSECPLAREHIIQGIEKLPDTKSVSEIAALQHPIQVLAKAYGFE